MKQYHLKQVPASNGINHHRSWECQITGIRISSNENVLGDKFYIDTEAGERCNTVWFSSPTAAILAAIKSN